MILFFQLSLQMESTAAVFLARLLWPWSNCALQLLPQTSCMSNIRSQVAERATGKKKEKPFATSSTGGTPNLR